MTDIACQNVEETAANALPETHVTTYFAPAGRETPDALRKKSETVRSFPHLQETIDAMPSMVAVLSSTRQIVAVNQALLDAFGASVDEVLSKRPGEAIQCIRAEEGPDGCGTSRYCAACGAVNAILESQQSKQKVIRECRILIHAASGDAPLDLQVTAAPFTIGGETLVFLALADLSQSKRLAVLQRVFFHDVLNTAGCIEGYVEQIVEETPENREIRADMIELLNSLIETIQAQRDLIRAEAGDLSPHPVPMQTSVVLKELHSQYQKHPLAEGRTIDVQYDWDGEIVVDRQLLYRVLGNMLKNALEATTPGKTVRFDCREQDGDVLFSVHNPEVMPEDVQLQIFQRSFSTKGASGRGIGTHSIKLFGEQYLGGKVGFRSQSPDGTTFWLVIPKRPADASA